MTQKYMGPDTQNHVLGSYYDCYHWYWDYDYDYCSSSDSSDYDFFSSCDNY